MRIVYVIYNHTNQCIKVGYTGNLNNRFSQIQLSTVDELTLLLTFNGGIEVESELHTLLVKYKLRGEWFVYNQEVLSLLLTYQQNCLNKLTFTQSKEETLSYKVRLICEEYLAASKTKKRTRVPMKYLRSVLDLPLKQIKDLMYDIGYVEWKDKAFNIHYYPD